MLVLKNVPESQCVVRRGQSFVLVLEDVLLDLQQHIILYESPSPTVHLAAQRFAVLEADAVPLHAVPLMRGAASVIPTLPAVVHAASPHKRPT